MECRLYNWKRFWCPPDATLTLTAEGYLWDLDSEWYPVGGKDVVPFETIAHVPCLGLLGEPGMGKSREMQAEFDALVSRTGEARDVALWFDLANYTTDGWLCKDIFENPDLRAWAAGTHHLHLFLDSLDEGRLSVRSMATLLPTEFEKLRPHLDRLSLRVACRTAEWPSGFEAKLKDLWAEDRVKTYELCPLREEDVKEAASANRLDVESFLDDVRVREAGPLAAKPITLEFLLGIRRSGADFPASRRELYAQGCRILCEEHSVSRRDSGRLRELSAGHRFAVAARLAALTVFANRAAIWTGPEDGSMPESDIELNRTCGGNEEAEGETVDVTEVSVRDTLNTGLFSSRGSNRMGWAHQSYAEFLAAWYLVHRQTPERQMMSLIVHPVAPDGKLAPQLYETAAWMASLSPDVWENVSQADPQVLLRGDLASARSEQKEQLTAAILQRFENEKLMDTREGIRQGYAKLAHPGLADQLRPYILDRERGWLVRRVAIDIAEACEVRSLQDELLQLALDSGDDYHTRVNAAHAVGRIGDDETKRRMLPLAYGECGDDPDDELKGCALSALWPHALPTEEVFTLLTSPRNPSLLGAYESFIHHMGQNLTESDLPAALGWVEQHPDWGLIYPFRRLVDDIVATAWDHLDSPAILSSFAQTVAASLKKNHCVVTCHGSEAFAEKVRDDPDRRHNLIAAMLPLLDESDARMLALTPHGEVALVSRDDLAWLIERLDRAASECEIRVISELVKWVFIPTDPTQSNLVHVAAGDHAALREKVRTWFDAIRLDSPEFEERYRDYMKREERRSTAQERKRSRLDPDALIAEFARKLEAGDPDGWWQLNLAIAMDRGGDTKVFEPDLTALPGWQQAVVVLGEDRILEHAHAYLLTRDPEPDIWLGQSMLYYPAVAGLWALVLLMRRAPDRLRTLPSDVWRKWAAITIAYPGDDAKVLQDIVALAYRAAPEEVRHALTKEIERENARKDGHVSVIRRAAKCWDETLGRAVLKMIRELDLKTSCLTDLLAEMLERRVSGASALAESFLAPPVLVSRDERSRAVAAAIALVVHATDGGWDVIWPVMQTDKRFGKAVISQIAGSYTLRESRPERRLCDGQLADLYVWMSREYSHGEDPNMRQAHAVGLREEIARWRDSLLTELKGRGTFSSYAEVERIGRELPEVEFLKWHALEAQEVTYRNEWKAPAVAHVMSLVRSNEVRLVRNGDELTTLLLESLRRLEAKLQGEVAAATDLWDEKPRWRPKGEERLSDYIVRHLREDLAERGIVANREVKITRGRTDIHVDAVALPGGDGYATASAVIEVKGCWNTDLDTAMKEQLVDHYLAGGGRSHGIYVVGWFMCSRWDDDDYRKSNASKHESIQAMMASLHKQAAELSVGGISVRAVVLDASLPEPRRQ